MFFFKRKSHEVPRVNLPNRRVFIFTGSHADILSMQTLLDDNNINYAIVNAYYEIDLVSSNTVLLLDLKGIHYMQKYGDCYRGKPYYLVIPKGKQIQNKPKLEPNIHIINYSDETMLNLLGLKKESNA